MDVMWFNSVLLVKGFDAKGFSTIDVLISNADTPALAAKGIIDDPKNPYTGEKLKTFEETDKKPQLFFSLLWQTKYNTGSKFPAANWFTVKSSIYDEANWEYQGYH